MLLQGGDKSRAFNIFAEILPHYKRDDYRDFILEARYEYASALLSEKQWQKALSQYQKIYRKGQIFRDVEKKLEALARLVGVPEIEKCRFYDSIKEWYYKEFEEIINQSSEYKLVKTNFMSDYFAHLVLKPNKTARLTNATPFMSIIFDFTFTQKEQALVDFLKEQIASMSARSGDKDETLCIYSLLYDANLLDSLKISKSQKTNIHFLNAQQMQHFLKTTELLID